jgi:hypothetical protein
MIIYRVVAEYSDTAIMGALACHVDRAIESVFSCASNHESLI